MKKFVMGLVIGAGLAFSVSAGADTLTGKPVQGMMPVTVDGQTLSTPSIIVEGSSYLPVRVVSGAASMAVAYDASQGVVNLQTKPKGYRQDDYDGMAKEKSAMTAAELQEKINTFKDSMEMKRKDSLLAQELIDSGKVAPENIPLMQKRIQQNTDSISLQQIYLDVYQK